MSRLGLVFGGRLWRHGDFVKFWLGQVPPIIGGQAIQLAVPTVAILALHAGPIEMGILMGLRFVPFLVLGLPAGVWVDRLPRRRVMAATDVVTVIANLSIPLAAAAGRLRIEQLYAVATVNGTAALFFDVAFQSYLLRLVGRESLVEGNAKLTANASVSSLLGPALGGALVQLVGAARAVGAGALGYALSFAALVAIRFREAPAAGAPPRRHFLHELAEGVRFTLGDAVLRRIVLCAALHNTGSMMVTTVLLLFAYGQLGLSPLAVGLAFAAGGLASLAGSSSAAAVERRLGGGATLIITQVLTGLSFLAIPLALLGAPALVLAAAQALLGYQRAIFNVIQVSFRQALTPDHLQGRMHATIRTVIWGVYPVGALLGGAFGDRAGLAAAIVAGGLLSLGSAAFLVERSVLGMQPEPA